MRFERPTADKYHCAACQQVGECAFHAVGLMRRQRCALWALVTAALIGAPLGLFLGPLVGVPHAVLIIVLAHRQHRLARDYARADQQTFDAVVRALEAHHGGTDATTT